MKVTLIKNTMERMQYVSKCQYKGCTATATGVVSFNMIEECPELLDNPGGAAAAALCQKHSDLATEFLTPEDQTEQCPNCRCHFRVFP